jgi:hypothetical protein
VQCTVGVPPGDAFCRLAVPLMAQAFQPLDVLLLKLLGIAVALAAVMGAAMAALASRPSRAAHPEQPIAFSHRHHVGDDGIDCRFCHASVEQAAAAGMPDRRVCLNCHSQLFVHAPPLALLGADRKQAPPVRWKRVHDLPDYVYFDHGIHVAKGVACAECHGRVDQMVRTRQVAPLTMQWCLDCHRDPGPHLRPAQAVFAPDPDAVARAGSGHPQLEPLARRMDCSTCHR